MTVNDTDPSIDLSIQDYKGSGLSKYLTVQPITAPSSFPAASSTKFSFQIPASVQKRSDDKLSMFLTLLSDQGAFTACLHAGYSSLLQTVKLFQPQNSAILSEINYPNVLTMARNRVHNSFDEAQSRPKSLGISALIGDVANLTQANTVAYGCKGGLFFLSSGSAVSFTTLQSLPIYCPKLTNTATQTTTLATNTPVIRVLFPWSNNAGAAVVYAVSCTNAWYLDLPLKDLGGIHSVPKYAPYMSLLQLDITVWPISVWTFKTSSNVMLATEAVTGAMTVANTVLKVRIASDTVAQQMLSELANGEIRIPCPYIWESQFVVPANQSPFSMRVPVSGFQGSKLRNIFWTVCSSDVTTVTGAPGTCSFSNDNRGGAIWDSYRSYWNSKPLQDDNIDYYNAFEYLKPVLTRSCYSSPREYDSCPVVVDSFAGVDNYNEDLICEDHGLTIAGTDNNYTLELRRTTGVATARNAYIFVETQRDLVLTKTGAMLV